MEKFKAIRKLYPNIVTMRDDVAYDADGNEVTYDNTAVETEIAKNAYKEKRAIAYKPLAEQLDMQYWDRVNGTDTWKQHIDAVKTAHPKPTE
jgi:NAD-dependent DNA ligase